MTNPDHCDAGRARALVSRTYAATTASIGTPNFTGQRCAYPAPATKSKRAVSDLTLPARFFILTRI